MRARLVVLPIRGRQWCFTRSTDPYIADSGSTDVPSTLKQLCSRIPANTVAHNAELLVDFVALKMNKAWMNLEKATAGSIKNKVHGLGLKILARIKPHEVFLKSISKHVTCVEVIYPVSLNARLVRRRLRHVAMSGVDEHKKYFYGSVSLLPLTATFILLPLPNIPLFWVLFRAYSHWQALKGSEKLLQLVSDHACKVDSKENEILMPDAQLSSLVLQPSKELEELIHCNNDEDGLGECAILGICKAFMLNARDVLKFRDHLS